MAWTDLSAAFAYGSKLTSAQMQNLRDNVSAVPAGDTGAPRIVNAAITSHTITWQRLYAASVTSGAAVGKSILLDLGFGTYRYVVLGADGTYYQTCPDFTPS